MFMVCRYIFITVLQMRVKISNLTSENFCHLNNTLTVIVLSTCQHGFTVKSFCLRLSIAKAIKNTLRYLTCGWLEPFKWLLLDIIKLAWCNKSLPSLFVQWQRVKQQFLNVRVNRLSMFMFDCSCYAMSWPQCPIMMLDWWQQPVWIQTFLRCQE